MRADKRALWLGKRRVAAAPAFVDYIIGFSNTLQAPFTHVFNAADVYPKTRNGLTFGVILNSGLTSDNTGPQGGNARFVGALNMPAADIAEIDLPNGTYTVESSQGCNFVTLSAGLRIANKSNSATLLAISGAPASGQAMDATGVLRNPANWDATRATASIVVTGGQGITLDKNGQSHFFMNYMRFTQTA